MPVGNDNASAFAHLEQRVSYLLERLEANSDHARRQSRTGRGRAAGHPAPSRKPACGRRGAGREHPQRARARRQRPDRHRQARIVRHPLQPVGNRPPHPGFARSRSQHARPCGRPAGDDRRRSAHVRAAPVAPPPEAPPAAAFAPPQVSAAPRARCRRSPSLNCRIPPPHKPPLPQLPAISSAAPPPMPVAAPVTPRAISEILVPHAAPPRAGDRAGSAARSPARARHPADRTRWLRRRSALRLPKARSAKFRQSPAKRPPRRASLPPRAAPPRPPRPRPRRTTRRRAARSRLLAGDKAKEPRPSPPRSARCWSARAWSSSCSAPSRWR